MHTLEKVLSEEEIRNKVQGVARTISSDYKDKNLILIGILKGSFIFLADLVRNITIPVKIDFIGASSYGSDTTTSGTIKITKDLNIDIKNQDIMIIEDIVDTGLTLNFLVDYLKTFQPASIKICTHIDKCERRETKIKIDYTCHSINKGFLVGYGLDCNEHYRNLPDIYHLKL